MTLAYLALVPGNILIWLVVGGVAGWITGRIMGGGYGIVGDIVLGLIGAFIGGLIGGFFFDVTAGLLGTLIVAILGSVAVVAVVRAVSHSSGHSSAL